MKLSNRIEAALRKEQEKQADLARAKARAEKYQAERSAKALRAKENMRAEISAYRVNRGLSPLD